MSDYECQLVEFTGYVETWVGSARAWRIELWIFGKLVDGWNEEED